MSSAPAVGDSVPSPLFAEVGRARAPVGTVDLSAAATGADSTPRQSAVGEQGAPRNTTEAYSESDSAESTAGPEVPSPVPETTPPLSPSGDSCGSSGSEPTSARSSLGAPEELSRDEKVLKDFVLHALVDPEMNSHQGSMNSERLANLTKSNCPGEFATVFGDTCDKWHGPWVSFLMKIRGNEFIMFSKKNCNSQTLWYLRSAKQDDWNQNDRRRGEQQREADRRHLRQLIEYLRRQPNHCCTLNSICTECTPGEHSQDRKKQKRISIFNDMVRPGDFLRWAKQQKTIRCKQIDQGQWIVSLVVPPLPGFECESSLHGSVQNPGVVPAVAAGVMFPPPAVIPAARMAAAAAGIYPSCGGFPAPYPHMLPPPLSGHAAEPVRMGPPTALGSGCTPQGSTCTTGCPVVVTTPMSSAVRVPFGYPTAGWPEDPRAIAPPMGYSFTPVAMPPPCGSGLPFLPTPPQVLPPPNPCSMAAAQMPSAALALTAASSTPPPMQPWGVPSVEPVPFGAVPLTTCAESSPHLPIVSETAVHIPQHAPSAPPASFIEEVPSPETAPMEVKPVVAPTVVPQPRQRNILPFKHPVTREPIDVKGPQKLDDKDPETATGTDFSSAAAAASGPRLVPVVSSREDYESTTQSTPPQPTPTSSCPEPSESCEMPAPSVQSCSPEPVTGDIVPDAEAAPVVLRKVYSYEELKALNSRLLMPPPDLKTKPCYRPAMMGIIGPAGLSVGAQVLKKVRGILNKIAPEKYAALLDQLWGEIQRKYHEVPDLLPGVVAVLFEVALDQPKFCDLYANVFLDLCKRFVETSHSGEDKDPSAAPAENGVGYSEMVKGFLLEKCQRRFEEGMNHAAPTTSKMSEEERERATLEEQRFRRQTLGNVRFIAELYKHDLFTERVMHGVVQQMLNSNRSEILEALAAMLTSMGKKLDSNPRGRAHCDVYFAKLQLLAGGPAKTRTESLLADVVELRNREWKPRHDFASSEHAITRGRQSVLALTAPAVAQAHLRDKANKELLAGRDAAPCPAPSKRSGPSVHFAQVPQSQSTAGGSVNKDTSTPTP